MDPQPAVGVNPTAADLARYNAWARRNNRPVWGAMAAPAPAAPAAAAAPAAGLLARPSVLEMRDAMRAGAEPTWSAESRRWELRLGDRVVVLTNVRGQRTVAGNDYRVAAQRANKPVNRLLAWQPGTHVDGQSDVAYLLDGTTRQVRRWDGHIGAYRVTTWGKDYYANHASQFTVTVPVFRVIRKTRADGNQEYVRALHGDGIDLNLTDQEMADYIHQHALAPPGGAAAIAAGGVRALGVVPAMGTPERQRQWIREALAAYLAAMPVEQGFKLLTEFAGSDDCYALDETREPSFDEEITTVRRNGTLAVQLALNRPLRGMVVVPDEMYAKTGMYPIAYEDNQGKCVINQLMLCLTKRKTIGKDTRVRNRKMVDGKKVTVKPDSDSEDHDEPESTSASSSVSRGSDDRESVNVPLFKTVKELEDKVDMYFNMRYAAKEVPLSGPMTHDQAIAEDVLERRRQAAHDRRVAAANAFNYAPGTGVPVEVPAPYVPEPRPRTVLVRPAPYEFGDWRTVGVTSLLIMDICDGEGMAVHVVHSDHLIQSHLPKNYKPGRHNQCICFNIWSDHAFFYDGSTREGHSAKQGIAHMKVVQPLQQPLQRLVQRSDDDDRVNYADMEPYTQVAFDAALRAGEKPSFYTEDMKDVIAHLETEKLEFSRHYGANPNVVSCVTVFLKAKSEAAEEEEGAEEPAPKPRKKSRKAAPPDAEAAEPSDAKKRRRKRDFITIRGITPEHGRLQRACEAFTRMTELQMDYKAEGMPSLVHRMIRQLVVTKRRGSTEKEKETLLCRQGGRCTMCDTKLWKFHVDHIKPLCEGGTNDLDNLQALCRECHESKTELEELARGDLFHPLESQLSPHLYKMFHKAPKPMERSGSWNIPASQLAFTEVRCLDVVGCRVRALLENSVGMPTFSPLDEYERVMDEDDVMIHPLDYFDYYYVHVPDVDLTDPEQADAAFPWTGSRNYCLDAVKYMLTVGAISKDNLVYGIKASRRLPTATLAAAFEVVRAAMWDAMLPEIEEGLIFEEEAQGIMKRAILSWIGLCNSTERKSWSEVRSIYAEDAKAPVHRRKYLGDGIWRFTSCTELLDTSSMRPFGEIALQMEHVFLDKGRRILQRFEKLGVIRSYGCHVDGIFYHNTGYSLDPIEGANEKVLYPSGEAMFKVKKEKRHKIPTWKQRYEPRSFDLYIEGAEWRILKEEDGGEDPQAYFAEEIFKNGGGLLNCVGGTGKTWLVNLLEEKLQKAAEKAGRKIRFLPMALRHASKALLPNGDTVAHALHQFAKLQAKEGFEIWAPIDEAGEISLSLWERIARWKLAGWKFVVCGDFRGQLLPMFDRWGDVMRAKNIAKSRFMYDLVNGLSCQLSTCRRCPDDKPHFDLVMALYDKRYFSPGQSVDDKSFRKDLSHALADYMSIFKPDGSVPDLAATMSHKNRVLMNALINRIQSDRQENKHWISWQSVIKGSTMQPQSCYIWPGIVMTGCTRGVNGQGIVNGLNYVVQEFDDKHVRLTVHPDFVSEGEEVKPITLKWQEFVSTLRLTHALPYVYYQGRTVREKTLLLMNVDSPHFTMRHLILGLGRVSKSEFVKICSPARETKIVAMAKQAYLEYEERASAARGRAVVPPEVTALLRDDASQIGEPECVGDIDDEDEVVVHEDCFDDSAFDDL